MTAIPSLCAPVGGSSCTGSRVRRAPLPPCSRTGPQAGLGRPCLRSPPWQPSPTPSMFHQWLHYSDVRRMHSGPYQCIRRCGTKTPVPDYSCACDSRRLLKNPAWRFILLFVFVQLMLSMLARQWVCSSRASRRNPCYQCVDHVRCPAAALLLPAPPLLNMPVVGNLAGAGTGGRPSAEGLIAISVPSLAVGAPLPGNAGRESSQDLRRAARMLRRSAGVNSRSRARTGTSAELLGSSPLSKPLTMTCDRDAGFCENAGMADDGLSTLKRRCHCSQSAQAPRLIRSRSRTCRRRHCPLGHLCFHGHTDIKTGPCANDGGAKRTDFT